jgi:hypothetical protein
MMAKGLRIAEPPRRLAEVAAPEPATVAGEKFSQVREGDKVQFNKRISRGVADGFEVLAIHTHRKVPDLLAEALSLLQERYGKV